MKLNEIKPLVESTTPIHLIMILNEIIRDQRVTNTAQWMVLAQLVEMFKFASFTNAPSQLVELPTISANIKPRDVYAQPTPKELLDELKRLEPEDQVSLAHWLLNQLATIKTEADVIAYCNPEMKMTQWINLVNKKQD